MSDYRITELAQTDLENIWDYTLNQWSLHQAETYIDGLLTHFNDIVSGKAISKDIKDVRPGYWRSSFNRHYVFYRFGEDKIVEIIRVLHVSMDVERHL